FGVKFDRGTIAEIHDLAVEGLARLSMRQPAIFAAAIESAARSRGVKSPWIGLLDPVVDWVLEKLGVTGWRRLAIRLLVRIIVLLLMAAVLVARSRDSYR